MVEREQTPLSGWRALLHGQAALARTLHRRPVDRLSAPTHCRRGIPLPAQSRHAALQHQRSGVAPKALTRKDELIAMSRGAFPGPIDDLGAEIIIDEGTLARTDSPLPAPVGLQAKGGSSKTGNLGEQVAN